MKIGEFLASSTKILAEVGVSSPQLDALILLEFVQNKNRTHFLAHPELNLKNSDLKKLNRLLKRRLNHEPIAYIVRSIEFYGRNFYVDERVLTPRPETETIIELLLDLAKSQKAYSAEVASATKAGLNSSSDFVVVDVGTGSGCLAITAKLKWSKANVIATDISKAALAVARRNARNLNADIQLLQGNLLEPLQSLVFNQKSIILANLPYVPDKYKVSSAVHHEPKIAIFGGSDGLNLYRQMFNQIAALANKPEYIFTESLPPVHAKMQKLAQDTGYTLDKTEGLTQLFKNSV